MMFLTVVSLALVAGIYGSNDLPMENPELYGGDILMDDLDDRGVQKKVVLWPNAEIPYVLDKEMEDQKLLEYAMEEYHERTCVRFVPRTTERQYIRIWRGNGCYSHIGKVIGPQVVSLGIGCLFKGIIMHELGHAVGFHHEHSRIDRDDHLTIHWDNVKEEFKDQFAKVNNTYNQLTKFDYNSVMLYGQTVFAMDRSKKSMEAKEPEVTLEDVSDKRHLSDDDVRRINTMYNCPNV